MTFANVSFDPPTGSMHSFSSSVSIAFLISGILVVNCCEICEMTSWMSVGFFIVLRAFASCEGEHEGWPQTPRRCEWEPLAVSALAVSAAGLPRWDEVISGRMWRRICEGRKILASPGP
ncbi:hypothetical protein B0H13DRAFT_720651 [Mycena leptocephala]|nr:hypothetical protein B0H13DRAFT_720651 [Mycena leptocephala]